MTENISIRLDKTIISRAKSVIGTVDRTLALTKCTIIGVEILEIIRNITNGKVSITSKKLQQMNVQNIWDALTDDQKKKIRSKALTERL